MSMLNKQAVILEIREGRPTATKYLIGDMWMVGRDDGT